MPTISLKERQEPTAKETADKNTTEETSVTTDRSEVVEDEDSNLRPTAEESASPRPETQIEEPEEETQTESVQHKKKKPKKGILQRLAEIGTISPKEVVEFTRHLAVMLTAGVTIFEAIQFLKEQSRNKVFAARLESITESLNNGQPLSTAMSKYPNIFPEIYTNMVRVGEQAGTLPQAMIDLADHLEESEHFKSKVKGALIYPKIIIGVMITFLFILTLFVMPRILTVFQSLGAELPTATRAIIAITNFMNDHVIAIVGGILGMIVFIYLLFKNPTAQKWRDLAYIKMPFVGHIVLNYNTAQVSQHFGTLFMSGITIVKALEITQSVIANKIFKKEIGHMVEKIKSGSALSQSFKTDSRFPPMFVKLIRVGERTGKLSNVVDYMKNYYGNLVDTDVKNITTIIEPIIMVLLGLMVAGLVVTVIGPIYQLISNVGQ